MQNKGEIFDKNCRKCHRLASFIDKTQKNHPDYYAAPVPAFGAKKARLLIVGLAPGMHGANRTGRAFTGDQSGVLLYKTLHIFGFSNKADSISIDDGLRLKNCRITNAVKCLPPQNKPTVEEINNCNVYLAEELRTLPKNSVVIALGTIAHNAVLRAMKFTLSYFRFSHNAEHLLERKNDKITLLDSYHCSRYNTQTKRLTEEMFYAVFAKAKKILN